jgi:hypothetical protein
VKVNVVEADHDIIIGKTIETFSRLVQILPNVPTNHEEEIRDLIDIALMTRDENWFNELHEKLESLQNKTV